MAIITIATDFGTADGFVGAMTGVIKSIAPDAELAHVTHGLKSIVKTSLVIERYYSYYPDGTIHLVVIDPTVGSDRNALLGFDGKYFFIGPDNGIFSRVILKSKHVDWWAINISSLPSGKISSTFHGRDIFAPAAALVASGKTPNEVGEKINNVVSIDLPRPQINARSIEGEVIDIDSFGNLISNIDSSMFSIGMILSFENAENIPIAKTYSDVVLGDPLGYTGSAGYLEIGINGGRAENFFKAKIGLKVRVML